MYKYCPKCGASYDRSENYAALHCTKCDFTFYINSKPTASTLIIENGKVLLGKRAMEPSKGKWDVIGGFLNFGEHPEDGARREAKEETGYDIQIEGTLGCFMDTYEPTGDATLNICYLAKIIDGTPKPGDDIQELQWFSSTTLPQDLAFKNGSDMLSSWVKIVKTKGLL